MGNPASWIFGWMIMVMIVILVGVNGVNGEEEKLRLPKFAVPKHYALRLHPDFVHLRFNGSVEIEVEIVEKIARLILNAAEIGVPKSCIYFRSKNKFFRPVKAETDVKSERIELEFAEILPIGMGVLVMKFYGNVSSGMEGLFWRTYTINGKEEKMVATQFESIFARRCFPCWDEPAFKATFTVTLDVPHHLMALSNMPVIEEKFAEHIKTVLFQKSPVMSTYLVAFIVGQFDHVERETSDRIRVRVYTPLGRASEGMFSLHLGVRTLEFYKEYLSMPYALPKLDMIGIPDFPQGMENYGLIIMGEGSILYDKNQSSKVERKQEIAEFVTHELAHQWFGNLVTLEWWTDTWLNEGFATWLSYTAIDRLFPGWDIWFKFVHRSESTLMGDAQEDTHPVVAKINHLNEIDSVFDRIVYQKGAHIVRMLNAYMGPKNFQHSLTVYLKRYAWSNTRTEDLWTVLNEVSGLSVNSVMDSWTRKKGFPVISAKINHHELELEQSEVNASHGDQQWIIPISLCCGTYDACHSIILQRKKESFSMMDLEGCSCSLETERHEICPWRKVNVNRTGFYRVLYDENLVSGLQHAVETKYLSTSDRYSLLVDTYKLKSAPPKQFASLLNLMSAYREEENKYIVDQLIIRSKDIVKIAFDATPQQAGCIKEFCIAILENYARKVGWEAKQDDSFSDRLTRRNLLTTLAILGHKKTQNEAIQRFHAYLHDRNTSLFPFDIRQAAYVAVMQTVSSSKRSDYKSLLRLVREDYHNEGEFTYEIRESLTSCPDPVIVLDALNFLFSSEVLKKIGTPQKLEISLEGRQLAWTWLKDKWEDHSEEYGSKADLTIFFKGIVSPFSSMEKAKEIKEFFVHQKMSQLNRRSLSRSISNIHMHAKWVANIRKERNLQGVVKKLSGGKC